MYQSDSSTSKQLNQLLGVHYKWWALSGFGLFVLIWLFFAFYTVTVEPGHHGVIVDKPYFVGNDGVRKQPIIEGRKFLFKTSDVILVRMQPQSTTIKINDFVSADNIPLDFESTINWRVTNAPDLVSGFGGDWMATSVKQQYLSIVRDAIKKRSMSLVMSDPQANVDMDAEITKALRAYISEQKIPVQVINVMLGKAAPPNEVQNQINETGAQEQRKRALVAATQAEVERAKEQTEKARADNAYRNAMELNPNQFVELERIKRYSDACAKSSHCIVTSGQATIQVPASGK
jgi:regulator of protease activity HflC (stomatin/prohibitin superfamily)